MLRELRVRNLAVIESLTVPFGPGLNVLTGETGAGKSILIDALTLLLGERAQPAETIRAGAETATIEAVFDAPRKSPVSAVLQEYGIAPEDGQLLVRRELVRGGRGRVFLNDTNTTLALLEKLGEALVEVHGQHEHQALLRPSRHLDLLDAFAGLGILRERLRQRHEEWRSASTELEALRASTRDQLARTAQSRESMAEIDAARLRIGEEEEHREERRRLVNAERLAEGAAGAYRELYEDPGSAVERAGRAATLLRELARIDPAVQPTIQALDTAVVHLDETARALRGYRDHLVFDPARLEAIERRLDEIGRLKRKYGESVDEILTLRTRLESDLEGLARADEDEGRLAERVDRLKTDLITRATDLAERREQAVEKLAPSVVAELAGLGLESAVFRVRLSRERAGPGDLAVGPEAWRLGPRGVDQAEFLFSGNAGRTRGRSRASPRGASSRARCSPSRSSSRRPTRCRCWSSTRWTSASEGGRPTPSARSSVRSPGRARSSASRTCRRSRRTPTSTSASRSARGQGARRPRWRPW